MVGWTVRLGVPQHEARFLAFWNKNPPWANRTVSHQTRYWSISGFRVWAAQGRFAGRYWRWGVPRGAPQAPPWAVAKKTAGFLGFVPSAFWC